jgi:NitT/TauT family transport system ATP-binding protein
MTYRPGTIKADVRVDAPRPRDSSDPSFNALKREIGAMVMVEQARHDEAERSGLTMD